MFTDMVGFTTSAQDDEAQALLLLREQEQILRPLFAVNRGREIKSTGDGFLVEFDSALRAVQCAIAVLQRLRMRNAQAGVRPIEVRISVHLGDVEERGGDIFGDAVNVASRMVPIAPPGGVCISRAVYDLVRNKLADSFEPVHSVKLKGVHVPVQLFRLVAPREIVQVPAHEPVGTRLAVLPLVNISPDPADEYLADGLTEELIGTLSRIAELRVIARTSVGQYKSTSKPIAQIAAELDVGTVLEGSVRKAGHRLRIALQLVDARTQERLWGDTFDRELTDVLAIQTEVAERTAAALRLDLLATAREALARRPTLNVTAYTFYLRGIHSARKSTDQGHREAIQYLEQAVESDPQFSPAHSYLANEYLGLSGESLAPSEALPRAKELVDVALALDPESSEAHTAWGNLAMQLDQDWRAAETAFKKAIVLNPSNAEAHYWYAILLIALRRFGEAKVELRKAVELEPLWRHLKRWLAEADLRAGDISSATALLEEEREASPNDLGARVRLGLLYAMAGRLEEARKEMGEIPRPTRPFDALDWADLCFYLGRPDEVRRLVADLESEAKLHYIPTVVIAALYARLGETMKCLEQLERGYQRWDRGLWLDCQSHLFDPVRKQQRFQVMLTRLKVPADA
jgi:adenylate cyclase